MKSVMSHNFSQVPRADIQRSSFDRSHGFKSTFDSGYLVPVFIDEALPGDTFNLRMTAFSRLATPIYPLMDNMKMDTFFFAVPLRLLWDNWERFNGAQTDPGDSTDFIIPQITSPTGGYQNETIYDYLGIPTKIEGLSHSALFLRAYNLIFNEWFRDENLVDSLTVPRGDGPDNPNLYSLQRRAKRHDYFTSALPWPQKGPSIDIPLGTQAPINVPFENTVMSVHADDASANRRMFADGAGGYLVKAGAPGNSNGLYADLTDATAATINQLRQAFQIQRLLERDARGGTRYIEIIKSHFGVSSPDSRLQRPEYLGGGSSPINITPIAQTSATNDVSPQANLSAMGTALLNRHGFTKSFTEHSIIIGLANVRADLTYQQGLNRMWSRKTRYDFYWPALAHIGEQAVLNKEIYAQGSANPTDDEAVFGYQERYAEYRYKPSLITGKMRSNDAQSLDAWHLSQQFGALPTLNETFINEDPPIGRVIAVPSEPQFLFDAYFQLRCARPMPLYGVPGMIDHF